MSPTITKHLNKLKQNKEIVSIKTNKRILRKEYIQGFKKWKKSTTPSSSGRHLCHYNSLLSLDGNHKTTKSKKF